MADLTFLGLSEDASVILLADSRGRKHTVPLEARLRAALRVDESSTGQMEIALNTLTPRDIQARLRAGATVAELADESGVDEVRIERYAGPPLAEREHYASLARDTAIDSHLGERTLGVVVSAAAEADGIPIDVIRWDAWLREDGSWQILSAYPAGKIDRVATWTFDARAHRIWADDREAEGIVGGGRGSTHRLSAVPDESVGVLDAAASSTKPARKKASTKTRASDNGESTTSPESAQEQTAPQDSTPAHSTSDDPGSHGSSSTPAVDAAAEILAETSDGSATDERTSGETGSAETQDPPARKNRRASVPSWDEILFGGTPNA